MDFQWREINRRGTDDNRPLSNPNRIPMGCREGNGGPSLVPSVPFPRTHCETDMLADIHHLEQEAYSLVLRAFKAQSDAITWEKESLLTGLRKELKVAYEEHKELICFADTDTVLQRIRDIRQEDGVQSGHDPICSPTDQVPHKKRKINQPVLHQSFARPSPHFHTEQGIFLNQQSFASPEQGSMMVANDKTHESGKMLAHVSSTKSMQYPPSGPTGRRQVANRVSSEGVLANSENVKEALCSSLIGKRLRTRWPGSINFYGALITDYNAVEGRHALVYYKGTANETLKWVNIAEISPDDVQWEGDDPGIPPRASYGQSGQDTVRSMGRCNATNAGRGRGRGRRKGPSEIVQIRCTDYLIKEVEKVFATSKPDCVETKKAKKLLKKHEQALLNAIRRLGDISNGECDVEVPTKLANQDGLRASARTCML